MGEEVLKALDSLDLLLFYLEYKHLIQDQ